MQRHSLKNVVDVADINVVALLILSPNTLLFLQQLPVDADVVIDVCDVDIVACCSIDVGIDILILILILMLMFAMLTLMLI